MQKLQAIAEDYKAVKNYVYTRFGGVASLPKLYPGYIIQNEMAKSDLRETLGMLGRKRYREQKRRQDERLHGYIKMELNRFLREEKPKAIYMPKLPTQN
ncbi:MAG: hypothetical protein HFJ10_12365 [Lachnospiraceae bacterium]|jgi:hypothetical protein|nr:hypothetical protein [Lachnospiraceae bacterium]